MGWFDKHSGLFSFIAILLTAAMAIGSLLLYFRNSGHVEGNIETNLKNLDSRILTLEEDYRLILSTLLNNNKAAINTINNSNIDPIKKLDLLKYFDINSQKIQQYLNKKTQTSPIIHKEKEKLTPLDIKK